MTYKTWHPWLVLFILLIPHVIIVDISFTEEIGGWLCSYFDGVLDGIWVRSFLNFPVRFLLDIYHDISHSVLCVGNFFFVLIGLIAGWLPS